jgi:hypothetical protein
MYAITLKEKKKNKGGQMGHTKKINIYHYITRKKN